MLLQLTAKKFRHPTEYGSRKISATTPPPPHWIWIPENFCYYPPPPPLNPFGQNSVCPPKWMLARTPMLTTNMRAYLTHATESESTLCPTRQAEIMSRFPGIDRPLLFDWHYPHARRSCALSNRVSELSGHHWNAASHTHTDHLMSSHSSSFPSSASHNEWHTMCHCRFAYQCSWSENTAWTFSWETIFHSQDSSDPRWLWPSISVPAFTMSTQALLCNDD